jgi:glutamate synthase domain-containing protein 3
MIMVVEEEKIVEISAKFLSRMKVKNDVYRINAEGMHYRELNQLLRALDNNGADRVEIQNVYGQRYIGTDLEKKLELEVYGTSGNDLGAFMNGPRIVVQGNAQDCTGNTMNEGLIIVHGHAGDITGYAMRGGKIFIRDDVGYRTGIHMKEYKSKKPYIIVGGTAQDFLGEYMAGGILVILGLTLKAGEHHKARFVGTGMHGGIIYVRGEVPANHLGKEVKIVSVNESDLRLIQSLVKEFCGYFNIDFDEIMRGKFSKIVPFSHRPYGSVYAY